MYAFLRERPAMTADGVARRWRSSERPQWTPSWPVLRSRRSSTAFGIGRDPNPHLGSGGTGTHHCVGAIADHIPGIAVAAEPVRPRSGRLNGFKEFRVTCG